MREKMDFGKWLREERKAQKLTQRELAKRTYMRSCTICGYERGAFFPSIDRVQDLAEALGYEVRIVRCE